MRLFFIRRAAAQPDVGSMVVAKALERVKEQAEHHATDFLCLDCWDRRCEQGQPCNAFRALADALAWDILAERAELN